MAVRRQNRPRQLAEFIKEEMSDILRKEMRDPRVELVSITEVEVTADLKVARIYVSRLGSEEERAETLAALRHATSYLRRLLAPRLTIRSVPEIEFRLDSSMVHAERVMQILNKLPELKDQPPTSPTAEKPRVEP
jgi:ribosome-binding factor A